MRRTLVIAMTVIAVLAGVAVPATAHSSGSLRPATGGGWTPLPVGPFDGPAGLVCDFAVHWDPIVNQAMTKVVETYPDGSPKRELAKGALFLRVSNADTGTSIVVDASGSAIFDFGTDGSVVWRVVGPVIARLPAGSSNLPRGLYTIDGVYRIAFSPTGFKTVTLIHGTIHNICADLA